MLLKIKPTALRALLKIPAAPPRGHKIPALRHFQAPAKADGVFMFILVRLWALCWVFLSFLGFISAAFPKISSFPVPLEPAHPALAQPSWESHSQNTDWELPAPSLPSHPMLSGSKPSISHQESQFGASSHQKWGFWHPQNPPSHSRAPPGIFNLWIFHRNVTGWEFYFFLNKIKQNKSRSR